MRGGAARRRPRMGRFRCDHVDVDPFVYLRDILARVCTHPASQVHELVPATWKERFGSISVR